MKSSNVRRLSVLLFLWIAPAACANAVDFTAFVGGAKPGKLNKSGILTSLDGGPIYGFRLGVNFVPLFGMEGTAAFSSDYLFPHNTSSITEAKGFVGSVNLMINIPVHKVVPYVTAGAGLIHQYGSSNLPVGTKLAFNYGGGLKFPKLVGPLGLRFDARGYTAVGVFSKQLNILEVSGGVLISFH
jgi:hypothetical protein